MVFNNLCPCALDEGSFSIGRLKLIAPLLPSLPKKIFCNFAIESNGEKRKIFLGDISLIMKSSLENI